MTTEEKASMWDALMSCQRIRVIGSAKLGDPQLQHIGIELWAKCPDGLDDSSSREKLKTFVNAMLAEELREAEYDDDYEGPVMITKAEVNEADDDDISNTVSITTTDNRVYHLSADKLDDLAEIARRM